MIVHIKTLKKMHNIIKNIILSVSKTPTDPQKRPNILVFSNSENKKSCYDRDFNFNSCEGKCIHKNCANE